MNEQIVNLFLPMSKQRLVYDGDRIRFERWTGKAWVTVEDNLTKDRARELKLAFDPRYTM